MTTAPPSPFDLATPSGHRRAMAHMTFADHGFLRVPFQNLHWISPQMARANQPSPKQLERYAAMGIRTILNLRGQSATGHYALEVEACQRLGLALVDFPLGSREAPSKDRLRRAAALFDTIAYPALMHCKSGADRAGLMAVLYLHLKQGVPIAVAQRQLSLRYLHVRQGKTGMLDHFFDVFAKDHTATGISFLDWVETTYDPEAVKASFMESWWANVLVDRILRRE